MYKIVEARTVGLNIKQFVIEAPRIARKQKPGQFLILRLHEKGERIPLTIKSSDPAAGTVTIVVQAIGKTTSLLNCLEAGDSILDIVGPLGHPSEIQNYGTAVILAGSVGTAMALPTANALKQAGNHVIFIEGARSKEMVVFEDEVRQASNEAYVMTDDGSYGEQGLVTKKLNEPDRRRAQDRLCARRRPGAHDARRCPASPRPSASRPWSASTPSWWTAPACAAAAACCSADKSKFACVDGPEFDASLVNFEVLMQRNAMYRDKECQSLKYFEEHKEEELAQLRAELAAKEQEVAELRAELAAEEAHHV